MATGSGGVADWRDGEFWRYGCAVQLVEGSTSDVLILVSAKTHDGENCISVVASEFWREGQSHAGLQAFLKKVDPPDQRTTGRPLRTAAPPHMSAVTRASSCTPQWCNETVGMAQPHHVDDN